MDGWREGGREVREGGEGEREKGREKEVREGGRKGGKEVRERRERQQMFDESSSLSLLQGDLILETDHLVEFVTKLALYAEKLEQVQIVDSGM